MQSPMAVVGAPAVLLWLLLLLLGVVVAAAAASSFCPAQYRDAEAGSDGQALLFGGYWGRCQSGCQPRDSMWSRDICQADPDKLSTINICEAWQRAAILGVAKQVSGGALMRFSPCDLFPFLRNRTLWLVGDSHTKGFYNALRCITMDFWDHSVGECAASSNATLQLELELAALKGHIYNTPPRCLHIQGSGRICLLHSPMGDLLVSNDTQSRGSLQVLQESFAAPHDIFYVSFARWHSNNCEGVSDSYVPALEQVGAFLNATRQAFPNVFFALPPYDHSKCLNPLMRTFDESLPFCLTPAEAGYNQSIARQLAIYAQDILHNKFGVPVIDSQSVSSQLYFGHVSARQSINGRTDCLHMCRPGMPEIDVFFFYQALQLSGISRIDEPLSAGADAAAGEASACGFVQPALFKPAGAPAASPSPSPVPMSAPDPAPSPDAAANSPSISAGGSIADSSSSGSSAPTAELQAAVQKPAAAAAGSTVQLESAAALGGTANDGAKQTAGQQQSSQQVMPAAVGHQAGPAAAISFRIDADDAQPGAGISTAAGSDVGLAHTQFAAAQRPPRRT